MASRSFQARAALVPEWRTASAAAAPELVVGVKGPTMLSLRPTSWAKPRSAVRRTPLDQELCHAKDDHPNGCQVRSTTMVAALAVSTNPAKIQETRGILASQGGMNAAVPLA